MIARAQVEAALQRALVFFLVGLALLSNSPAYSQHPHIVQTAVEPLETSPPRVRIHFSVVNDEPVRYVCVVAMHPLPECSTGDDSCCVLACSGPAEWVTGLRPIDGGAVWGGLSCIANGTTQTGFALEIAPHNCCYGASFSDAIDESIWGEITCFDVSGIVPTHTFTWGRLKASYR